MKKTSREDSQSKIDISRGHLSDCNITCLSTQTENILPLLDYQLSNIQGDDHNYQVTIRTATL